MEHPKHKPFDELLWQTWMKDDIQSKLIIIHGAHKFALLKWHPDNPNRGEGSCAYCIQHPNCSGCALLLANICGFISAQKPSLFSRYWEEAVTVDDVYLALLNLDEKPPGWKPLNIPIISSKPFKLPSQ